MDLTKGIDEPLFNFDPVGKFVDGDSDGSDSTI